MNFKQIEYFVVLSEELNFTKASQRLYVTQQSLSEAIGKLEAEYGVRLFERSRPLKLTEEGSAALEHAKELLKTYQKLEKSLIERDTTESLVFGATRTRNRFITPEILPKFKKQHPNVGIKTITAQLINLEEMLLDGRVDLIMGYDQFQSSEIKAIPIAKERTFLLIPKTLLSEIEPDLSEEMIKARCKGADLKDFKNYPFMFRKKGCYSRKMADSLFEEYGITPNIIYEDDDNDILFNLCLSGIGAMFLSSFLITCGDKKKYIQNGQIYCFPINNDKTTTQIIIGYNKGDDLRPCDKTFVEDFIAVHKKYSRFEDLF